MVTGMATTKKKKDYLEVHIGILLRYLVFVAAFSYVFYRIDVSNGRSKDVEFVLCILTIFLYTPILTVIHLLISKGK